MFRLFLFAFRSSEGSLFIFKSVKCAENTHDLHRNVQGASTATRAKGLMGLSSPDRVAGCAGASLGGMGDEINIITVNKSDQSDSVIE